MSEIEKLYVNAKVNPFRYCYNCVDNNGNRIENSANCPSRHNCSNTCDTPEYEFTAEKQLKLIKQICPSFQGYTFEEGLAKCVNNLWEWEILTKEEKAEIRKILEG